MIGKITYKSHHHLSLGVALAMKKTKGMPCPAQVQGAAHFPAAPAMAAPFSCRCLSQPVRSMPTAGGCQTELAGGGSMETSPGPVLAVYAQTSGWDGAMGVRKWHLGYRQTRGKAGAGIRIVEW